MSPITVIAILIAVVLTAVISVFAKGKRDS